jgi:hypothetical protein
MSLFIDRSSRPDQFEQAKLFPDKFAAKRTIRIVSTERTDLSGALTFNEISGTTRLRFLTQDRCRRMQTFFQP